MKNLHRQHAVIVKKSPVIPSNRHKSRSWNLESANGRSGRECPDDLIRSFLRREYPEDS